MDPDGDKENQQTKRQNQPSNFLQRYVSNVSDVLSPIWLRRIIQVNNGSEWFILGCRYRFLLYFRLFLVVLYISYEIIK
jgi:hypothetical protein